MAIFKTLLREYDPVSVQDLRFGRFSDSYKPLENYEHWNEAIRLFRAGEFKKSLHHTFLFIQLKESNNLTLNIHESAITFQFFQGSKLISGNITGEKLRAEAKIASVRKLDIGFMRLLLETNFDLDYSRYCLDADGDLCIVFDSYLEDAAPHKIYFGLKELALRADKLDDILVDQYAELEEVNTGHIVFPVDELREIKYNYFQTEINQILDLLDNEETDLNRFPGGISYLLLALNYKLDYILKPEGALMECIERNHREYFKGDGAELMQKNARLVRNFREIVSRSRSDINKEFYHSVYTFGLIKPASIKKLKEIIGSELKHVNWYYQNQYFQVALAIPVYIVCYGLFNYAFEKPIRDLLHLFLRIVEQPVMCKLDEDYEFRTEKGLNKQRIRRSIKRIITDNEKIEKSLNPFIRQLDFTDLVSFSTTYLQMLNAYPE